MRDRNAVAGMFRLACVPVVWTAHFVACYLAVSIACKFGAHSVHLPVVLATLVALALFAWIAVLSFRHRLAPTQDRSMRFLALATMMLCALSALAVLWVAFPAAVLPPCAT